MKFSTLILTAATALAVTVAATPDKVPGQVCPGCWRARGVRKGEEGVAVKKGVVVKEDVAVKDEAKVAAEE
jgi:hypothetical protein